MFSAHLILVLWVSLDCSRSILKKNLRSFTGISITVISAQKIFSLGYIHYQMFILSLLYRCCAHIFQLSSYTDMIVTANQKWMTYVMDWDATHKGAPSKLLVMNFYSHLVPFQSLVIVLSWKQNEVAGKAQYAPTSTTRLVKKQDPPPPFFNTKFPQSALVRSGGRYVERIF